MKPHPDVIIPSDATKEERSKILEKARHLRSYHKNKEKNKQQLKQNRAKANKKYYEKNKDKCKTRSRKWAKEHEALVKERGKQKSKEYSKRYYEKHKDRRAASNKKWRQKNKDAHRNINKQYRQNRRLRDPLFVVKEKLRASVRAAFTRIKQNKFSDTQKLLNCTWKQAKLHIEVLWSEGMSWENHGNGPGTWNIDHIRPVHTFSEEDMHLMNDIQNLQPLWWEENNKKSGQWH